MNSSTAPVSNANVQCDPPLAASAGVPYRPSYSSPIAEWIDLMEMIEALCPQWPEPELKSGNDYRL